MPTENELKPLADAGPVERMVRPRAWAVGASFWGSLESVPYMLRAEAEPLYDSEALDIYRSLANEFQRAHKAELKAKSPGRNQPKGQPDW